MGIVPLKHVSRADLLISDYSLWRLVCNHVVVFWLLLEIMGKYGKECLRVGSENRGLFNKLFERD